MGVVFVVLVIIMMAQKKRKEKDDEYKSKLRRNKNTTSQLRSELEELRNQVEGSQSDDEDEYTIDAAE